MAVFFLLVSAEGEAGNPKSQKQGFLLISFSREGLCYVGKVVKKKEVLQGREGEREVLQASVRLLGDGRDVVFRGKDGGEISGGG